MSIAIRSLTKTFGHFTALKDVSLDIPSGELVALLGPSGSGKTTLLRIVAGLEFQDAGEVCFEGEDARDDKEAARQVGFVFQHYALFRHMTVFENIAFGLRVRPRSKRPSEDAIRVKVTELLKLVQLENLARRYPSQLSGGQRQRIAIARALAVEPKVLLLDEPFGALDAKVRKELRQWLRQLHDEIHVTSIFVTHDQEEALEVADRIVVMNEGCIEQMGTPEEVYHRPASAFVYNFLGDVNLFHGRVEDGKAHIGSITVDLSHQQPQDSEKATIYIRPHLFDIHRVRTGKNSFKAVIKRINPAGSVVKVELVSEWGGLVQVEMTQERYRELALKRDEEVFVSPKEEKGFFADYSI
ncbi:MAG: sulfate ABC transporter ATP-binding protein [Candidatus Omnitrophica bacterium]|nr:sulfate ABC transporter ATP-binding protein [Candidatus Omnitrophota bacterium]